MEAARKEVVSARWYSESNAFVILRLTQLLKGYRMLTSKSVTSRVLCTGDSNDYELEKDGY